MVFNTIFRLTIPSFLPVPRSWLSSSSFVRCTARASIWKFKGEGLGFNHRFLLSSRFDVGQCYLSSLVRPPDVVLHGYVNLVILQPGWGIPLRNKAAHSLSLRHSVGIIISEPSKAFHEAALFHGRLCLANYFVCKWGEVDTGDSIKSGRLIPYGIFLFLRFCRVSYIL